MLNLYREYLAEEERNDALLEAMEADALAEEEQAALEAMTAEEAWIYEHGVNY